MKGFELEIKGLKFNPPRASAKGVLQGVNFKIKSGEFVTFIGQNGHGKSSIFKAISGELNHTSGLVKVGGKEISDSIHRVHNGVGIVHQYVQDDLIKELSIIKNIQIRQLFSNDKEVRKDANDSGWLTKINTRISQFLSSGDNLNNDTLVDELSGGQRQLLNVLIALELEHFAETKCRLLLLDEHLTSLDVLVQKKVMNLIKQIISEFDFKPTILMITHDFQYAVDYSDKIIVIKDGKVKETIRKSNTNKWNIDYLIKAIA